MDRRSMLGCLGVGTAGLLALSENTARADHEHHHDHAHEECLDACGTCARECSETFQHCFKLVESGQKQHAHAARLALDCSQFCGLSAGMISRGSVLMSEACQACADACKKCGDECARFDSEQMKACVEACRKCESTCREMVKSMLHAAR